MAKVLPLRSETRQREAPPPDPPLFGTIAIAGFGLIGGSIALAVKRRWPAAVVIAVDDKEATEAALRMRAADVAGETLLLAAEADLVVLAAPVLQNLRLLAELPEYLHRPAIVTDVGSTKRTMARAAASLPDHLRFVGGHPFAGAARGGVQQARADLFDGHAWMLALAEDDVSEAAVKMETFVSSLGAVPRRMDADVHDRLAAAVSHLPQLAATVLMDVVGTQAGEEGLAIAGRGLLDTTRLASSASAMWADVVATNEEHIAAALDGLIAALTELRGSLGRDRQVLERMFASANTWRAALERGHSGEQV